MRIFISIVVRLNAKTVFFQDKMSWKNNFEIKDCSMRVNKIFSGHRNILWVRKRFARECENVVNEFYLLDSTATANWQMETLKIIWMKWEQVIFRALVLKDWTFQYYWRISGYNRKKIRIKCLEEKLCSSHKDAMFKLQGLWIMNSSGVSAYLRKHLFSWILQSCFLSGFCICLFRV